MHRGEALQILRDNRVEIGLGDHRSPEQIVIDMGLGSVAAASQLEFIGLAESGTYTEAEASAQGLVVYPHAFEGQRVYRVVETQ